jgi:tryptophanase
MSMWLNNQSLGLSLFVMTGLRAVQLGALSLVRPANLRRAQAGALRVITLVAGH